MDTQTLMEMPLVQVCSLLQERMARQGTTKDKVKVTFKDITFTISAESETVPESWEEFLNKRGFSSE